MKILSLTMKILSRWDANTVLWEGEAGSIGAAVIAALKDGAVLRDADLTGAVLRDADLTGAVFTRAVLRGAVLRGADLTDADLTGAVLTDADLTGADLTGAVLRGAVFTRADLTDAVLTDAVLTPIRDDVWAVLSGAPAEVPTLLAKLRAGEIDGSCYEGTCACLVGTLANARGCSYQAIETIAPNSGRPAEVWFAAIRPGDTPATNAAAKEAEAWIVDWLDRVRAAFGTPVVAG